MSETETAWAAGLFEGEGTITRHIQSPRRWQLALASTDEDVILRFVAAVPVGKLYGPYTPKAKRVNGEACKPYWKWVASDKAGVIEFARIFRPWLGERRRSLLDRAVADFEHIVGRNTYRTRKDN